MSIAFSPSDPANQAQRFAPVRAEGAVRIGFAHERGRTVAREVGERGGFRARFPDVEGMAEAVLINTGGGMTGGDRLAISVTAGEGTRAAVTTQSAEKVYRSNGPQTQVAVSLALAEGARLDWLPQETILFSGARLSRRIDVTLAGGATLLMAEPVVYGRVASGETLGEGGFRDSWRVRRDGVLAFADEFRLGGDIGALLARPALGGGARSASTILYVAADAPARLEEARQLLSDASCACGASAWNGMLLVRMLAADPGELRRASARFLSGFRGESLPRVW